MGEEHNTLSNSVGKAVANLKASTKKAGVANVAPEDSTMFGTQVQRETSKGPQVSTAETQQSTVEQMEAYEAEQTAKKERRDAQAMGLDNVDGEPAKLPKRRITYEQFIENDEIEVLATGTISVVEGGIFVTFDGGWTSRLFNGVAIACKRGRARWVKEQKEIERQTRIDLAEEKDGEE